MKQKDIVFIVGIALFSAVISFVVSNKLFVTPDNRQQKVEVVDPISSNFDTPSKKYFNSSSIDPTQNSGLGGDNNQNPFNGSSQ